jgi:molybdate transport system regulatory protein
MEIGFRFWIEKDGKPVMGKGGYEILKAVDKFQSLSKASKELGMSYRFMWDYLRRMEKTLGEKVVESERGGVEGGRTKLTPLGKKLVETYESFEKILNSVLSGVKGVVESVEGDKIVVRVESNIFSAGDVVVLSKVMR